MRNDIHDSISEDQIALQGLEMAQPQPIFREGCATDRSFALLRAGDRMFGLRSMRLRSIIA